MNDYTEDEDRDWLIENDWLEQISPSSREPNVPLIPKSVIGNEDRVLVADARRAPFRYVCQLIGYPTTQPSSSGIAGTAFLIGRRTLVTAAHNFRDTNGQPIRRIELFPGVTGDRDAAFLGGYLAVNWQSHSTLDIGVIQIGGQVPAEIFRGIYHFEFGAMSWSAVAPAQVHGKLGLISGYPRDRPGTAGGGGIQANQYFDRAYLGYKNQHLHYLADTEIGQSGSPILFSTPDSMGRLRTTAIGVHTEGGDPHTGNSGVMFSSDVAQFISQHLASFDDGAIA